MTDDNYVPNLHSTQHDCNEVSDSPELTADDFVKARPLKEAMRELYAHLEKVQTEGLKTCPARALATFVKRVRASREMTQREFADTYGMLLGRLHDWEQGRFKPDAMTRAYLAIIEHEPEAVPRALNKERQVAL